MPGPFPLGRVAIAGGTGAGYAGRDPLLVVASEGDCLFRPRWAEFVANLPPDLTRYDGADGAAALARAAAPPPARAALLFEEAGAGAPPAPSHISFLSGATNGAMVEFLSPLLPLARLLRVPVLDFDTYQSRPDSDVTARAVLPAVLRFVEARL